MMNFQRTVQAIVFLLLLFAVVLAGQRLVRDAGEDTQPTPTSAATISDIQPVDVTSVPPVLETPEEVTETLTNTPTATSTATQTPTTLSVESPTLGLTTTPQSTNTSTATATLSATPRRTSTATDTSVPPTLTFTPRPSATNTTTPTPSVTFTPSNTPSRTPSPTITPFPTLTPTNTPFASSALITDDVDLINILLLGTDNRPDDPSVRTDTIIVVSINPLANSVNMLSIPRDLYVPIPNYGYSRISYAVFLGQRSASLDVGITLLKQTIEENFGFEIDYYALIDFAGFKEFIDYVGGVDILVDCALEDYRLIAGRNPDNPNNYALYELTPGLHHMNGDDALWYVRSRITTSDFDRNRRQQVLLRAIWAQFQRTNNWSKLSELWDVFHSTVTTDMTLNDLLELLPIAISLDYNLIESHFIGAGEVEPFTTDSGAAVLRLLPSRAEAVIDAFLTPPTLNRLYQEHPRIEVVNQSGHDQMDLIAADRLTWEGFIPHTTEPAQPQVMSETIIYDFTGVTKGSSLAVLQRVLNIPLSNVVYIPDPDRDVDYRVVLGANYDSCTYSPWEGIVQVN